MRSSSPQSLSFERSSKTESPDLIGTGKCSLAFNSSRACRMNFGTSVTTEQTVTATGGALGW